MTEHGEQAARPAQVADRLAQLTAVVGPDRLLEALDLAIEAAKVAGRPPVIDLNDPVSENAVAEAICRLAPEGAYVPLSVRYPWRFGDFADITTPQTTLVDAVVEALRSSAAVHDAERIPHLVAPLLALAEALEHGALVPGPPPGRCGVPAPGVRGLSCELRAGHAGQHEGADWESVRDSRFLELPRQAYWTLAAEDEQ